MKRNILIIFSVFLIIFSIFLIGTNITFGFYPFGGKIVQEKAVEVQIKESSGYSCNIPGRTITIRPIGRSPTSYIIPYGVSSMSQNQVKINQSILGNYSSPVMISCYRKNSTPTYISLPVIYLFGNSNF